MKVRFTDKGLDDYTYWKAHDTAKAERIRKLLANIAQTPYSGIGKPEQLLYDLQGWWSRRIDREHRLIYKVEDGAIIVAACRYHYGK